MNNFLGNITWSVMGQQTTPAKKVYYLHTCHFPGKLYINILDQNCLNTIPFIPLVYTSCPFMMYNVPNCPQSIVTKSHYILGTIKNKKLDFGSYLAHAFQLDMVVLICLEKATAVSIYVGLSSNLVSNKRILAV